MKVEKLVPAQLQKVQFNLASFKLVPNQSGCYVLATFENDILYIGLSEHLNTRFQQHLNNIQKTSNTIDGKAIWFYYTLYDKNNLPKLERTWINQFTNEHGRFPILNKVNSPL